MKKLLCALVLLSACQTQGNNVLPQDPVTPAFGERINFTQAGLFPEGIDYDPVKQNFLVSSVRLGTVGRVNSEGFYTGLVNDEEILSAIGILADSERDRLLVAVSDQGSSPRSTDETRQKIAKLGIYSLSTGVRQRMVDLGALKPGDHFANDIAIDAEGNAYVTDSKMPLIYRVTPEGEASIFAENELLGAAPEAFGLNGLVYHPDGYLLVAKSANNAIYKVSVSDPQQITQVQMPALPASPDGLELRGDDLVVVSNGESIVNLVSSTDNWATATIANQVTLEASFPTTAVTVDEQVHVLEAKLGQAGEGESVTEFSIRRADF